MGKKIMLLVDDARFMRKILADIFEKKGYEIIEAQDGKDAIDKYKKVKPDLVTMDIIMPQMDGIEAVKNIIALDNNAKIIMITAIGQEGKMKQAVEAGAIGYIVKPFHPSKVLEEVKNALSG